MGNVKTISLPRNSLYHDPGQRGFAIFVRKKQSGVGDARKIDRDARLVRLATSLARDNEQLSSIYKNLITRLNESVGRKRAEQGGSMRASPNTRYSRNREIYDLITAEHGGCAQFVAHLSSLRVFINNLFVESKKNLTRFYSSPGADASLIRKSAAKRKEFHPRNGKPATSSSRWIICPFAEGTRAWPRRVETAFVSISH